MNLVSIVGFVFQLLYVLLLVRVLLSWIPGVNYYHPVVQFIHRTTSPVLNPIRRLMPPVAGLDLSPLVAILLLSLVRRVVVELIVRTFVF